MLTIFFFSSLAFSADYIRESEPENLPEVPEQIARWHINPTVSICESAIVTEQQVVNSYAVFGLNVNPKTVSNCTCERIPGEIRFVSPKCAREWAPEEEYGYGFTSIGYVSDIKMMVSASVSIVTPDNEIVLTHEVGHSLGWMHSSDSDHLMYPFYDLMTNSLTVGMTTEKLKR